MTEVEEFFEARCENCKLKLENERLKAEVALLKVALRSGRHVEFSIPKKCFLGALRRG